MTCFLCNGVLDIIGKLGLLVHYRCRHCGAYFSGPDYLGPNDEE